MRRYALLLAGLLLATTNGCGSNSGGRHLAVTPTNFQSAIRNSDKVVLLDCWAPWCGPCRTLSPTIDELADDYEGRIVVAKMNVDDAQDIARELNISSIPAVLIFKNGKEVARRVGVQPKRNYTRDLEQILSES